MSMKRLNHWIGEDGASAILIALSLVVLMGFAAVAIDAAGAGFNERRQDQSAADVGALAAVQFARPINMGHAECTGLSGMALSRCNGAVEARDIATSTLDSTSVADWTNASLCASPPAGYATVAAVSQCIAFSSNNQRAWVRIPTISNDTTFAGAIGINSISATADAIAGSAFVPPGGVLPFLLPGNAAGANYNCLKAGANPKFGECDDAPIMGNFGSADFFLYGDATKQWTAKCSGDTNGRLVANIARGIDHPLTKHPTGVGGGIEESSNCPDYNAGPNMTDSQTGIGSNLEDGLLYGGSAYSPGPYPGAIQKTGAGSFKVRNGGGSTPEAWVENLPIWTYLKTDGSLTGTDCDPAIFGSAPNPTLPALMDTCIGTAKSTGIEIFTDDLVTNLRFGWVPELWELDFTGNPYHIKDFRPVFLDTTFYGCNASSCDIMHSPGINDTGSCPASPVEPRITCGTPGNKNKGLDAVTAWILHADIVPEVAKAPSPGSANQRSYNLVD